MKIALLGFYLLCALLGAQITTMWSADASQNAPADVQAKAIQAFYQVQSGKVDRSRFTDDVNAQATDEDFRTEGRRLQSLGRIRAVKFLRTYIIKGVPGYDFMLTFDEGDVIGSICFDRDGKIAGQNYRPVSSIQTI